VLDTILLVACCGIVLLNIGSMLFDHE